MKARALFKRLAGGILAAALSCGSALAGSTINPAVPAQGSPLTSAVIRSNFLAAYDDINRILNCFSGTTAPSSPTTFQFWCDTSASPVVSIKQWDGATWVVTGRINTSTHLSTLPIIAGGTAANTAPAARVSLGIDQYTGVGDANYVVLATDRTLGTTAALTASRTWTLPAASTVNAGDEIYVGDFAGGVTSTNTLVLARAGSDTVNGVTSVTINTAYGAYLLRSDGISKWSAQPSLVNGVISVGGATGVITLGTGLTVSGGPLNTLAPGDACAGPRLAKTANYTVANTDRFSKFSLGGAVFFTLTFSPASGYDADFSSCIHNANTGRGEHIAVSGGKDFILWPDQVAMVSNDNNSWAVRRPNRWKVPNSYGPITLQADYALGTDVPNATDCLGNGSEACKTVQGALGVGLTEFDFDGRAAGNSSLVVQMAVGDVDEQCVHYSTHGGIPGAQGGLAVTIKGAAGAAFSCATTGVEIYFGSIVYIDGVNITSTAGYCLAAHDRAKIFVGGGSQIGPCATGGMFAEDAKIEMNGTVNIVGDMAYFALAQQNGVIATANEPVKFLNNATFSGAFVQADSGGQISFGSGPGTTITVAPFAAIGQKCFASSNGMTFSASGVPNTYWPGTVNCASATQGQNL